MTKKPGILIGVLALIYLVVPLPVLADVPKISGLGLSVRYDDIRENKALLQPKILFINNGIAPKLKIEDLTPLVI